MRIDVSVLIWTIINFLLLMVLLNFTLFRPLRTFMAKRQQEIDAGVAAGKAAQEALADQKARQAEALAQRNQAVTQARQAGANARIAQREQAEVQANRDAEQRREAFLESLSQEETALAAALEGETQAWVDLLAEKLSHRQGEEAGA